MLCARLSNQDLSLHKNFHFTERIFLQFHADAIAFEIK
jgi:hypothetical protein